MKPTHAYGCHPDPRVDVAAQAFASKHWHWDKLGEDERDRFRDRARDVLAALDALEPAGRAADFDTAWPTLVIPGEFDAMDATDQGRWRGALQQAFNAGRASMNSAA